MALVSKRAALLVTDAAAAHTLVKEAIALIKDLPGRKQLIENIIPLARPDAAIEIAQEVLKLVKRKS